MKQSMHKLNFSSLLSTLALIFYWLLIQPNTVLANQQIEQSPEQQNYQRIVSLSPHLTELIYSAGAGDKLVGVVEYSDYPEEATEKPIIGRYNAINLEAIIKLQPDLIISWKSGNRIQDIERLKQFGFNVWQTDIEQLHDIPKIIQQIGHRSGTSLSANKQSQYLQSLIAQAKQQYSQRRPVKTFYQIWNKPLMTINNKQYISMAMQICGADNSFKNLPLLASEVSLESVLAAEPELILVGGEKSHQANWISEWQTYKTLNAVRNGQVYALDNDQYQRPTARLIEGLKPLCEVIDQAR